MEEKEGLNLNEILKKFVSLLLGIEYDLCNSPSNMCASPLTKDYL